MLYAQLASPPLRLPLTLSPCAHRALHTPGFALGTPARGVLLQRCRLPSPPVQVLVLLDWLGTVFTGGGDRSKKGY